ncbi:hypothetical protein FE257_003737 [Aspergillus nanangensis]|uniref:Uncharacterized protein n=1 Tax=Aspergillus nanangensis TaxID=2582783 RepID=A0AAD4GMP9_ASPNN|nr:hypothetical protein FE257_003737 [Aspergillus nanangensis]
MQLIVEQGTDAKDISLPLYIQSQPSKGWLWWMPNIWPSQAAETTIPDPISIPDYITAISSMLATLKSSVLDQLDPPLKYNQVAVSMPDVPGLNRHYPDLFKLSCHLAGLDMFVILIASNQALLYNGVKDWNGPGNEPPPHINFFYLRNMLTISYNPASLAITLHPRDVDGWVSWDPMVNHSTLLGADSVHEITGYWDEVRKLLAEMIGDAPVDYIQLIGSHALHRGLVQVLQDVIASRDNINPAVLDRYIQGNASEQDKEDALFASANHAAIHGRYGMLTGFATCLISPNCPVDDDKQFEEEDWWSILGILNPDFLIP